MIIHVVQGERELVADCRSLARFTLSGIPPLAAGAARIRVSFTVDADGLLTVAAQEKTTGVRAQVEVKPSYGLRDDEIAKMLEDSRAFAKSDVRARLLAERKTEAAQLVEITRAALSADGDALLSPPERVAIEEKINALAAAADGDDDDESADAIHAAIKALDAAAADFAARRMNAGVKRALAGRTVDEV
jgi:molecular chaperone HscA